MTISNPDEMTGASATISNRSFKISVPGKDLILLSPEESFMPTLKLDQLKLGNAVTTVSGSGASCRITTQYIV